MFKFEKVSYEQFEKDYLKMFDLEIQEGYIKDIYDNIKLPCRSTKGSCGYDFFSPFKFVIEKDGIITIPTGIRVFLAPNTFLMCAPRSGLGFKYGMSLANTIGYIDQDYVYSSNEGHIMAKLCNESKLAQSFIVDEGSAFMQGICLNFNITDDDNATGIRNGGFGSTDKKEQK